MDIRGPRLRKPSDGALSFTSSMAFDGRIAIQVIKVNMAHMAALVRAGEVDREVGAKCMRFLLGASSDVSPDAKAEDFHQQLEQEAVDSLGVEAAGFLNYGKSRNDQVAAAVRMELRRRIVELADTILRLQDAALGLVKRSGQTLIPGYTHLQRAQPVTLAHHFFAYFDSFQRDADRLLQVYERVNLSPMGAAAMAGTTAKVDRRFIARALGFDGLALNSIDAVSSRDFAVEAISCAAMTMIDASRLAEELILWSSAEFGLLEVDDPYAASSSIMPQKKNAVAAETVRAKAGSVLGSLVAVCTILKALPYSYNLDLQETSLHLWRALDDANLSAHALAGMVSTLKVNAHAAAEGLAEDNSTAVALANYIVKQHGVSFRQAHSIVGQLVRTSEEKRIPLHRVASSDLPLVSRKYAKELSIDEKTARLVLDPGSFLAGIATEGGSNPRFVASELEARRREHSKTRSKVSGLARSLRASDRRLNRMAKGLAREVNKGS